MLHAVPLKGGDYNPCSKIQDLVALTGDGYYICLYIWQGKIDRTEKKWVTKFKEKYTNYKEDTIEAIPTKDAGEFREVKEGKKYSSDSYELSEMNGRVCLHHAPIKIEIHNSGTPESKSVIFEWPHEDKKDKKDGKVKYVLNEHTVEDKNAIYVKLNQLSISKKETAAGGKRKSKKYHNNSRKKSKKKSRKRSKKGRNNKNKLFV